MQPQKWVSLMIILMLIQITKALGEMVSLHFSFMLTNPDDHKFFELGYCGHTQYPHSKIFLDQERALIISQFQEEDHSFIRKTLQDDHIHVVSLYYVYKPNTDTPRTNNTLDDENGYKLSSKHGGESSGFHRHMISVVVFSYSETLKVC